MGVFGTCATAFGSCSLVRLLTQRPACVSTESGAIRMGLKYSYAVSYIVPMAGAHPKLHDVELLWFTDCPNHQVARALLHEIVAELAPGSVIRDIDATEPSFAERVHFPGSPTIRVDGRDVQPGFVDPRDYSPRCRLYPTQQGLERIPPREWIEAALR